MKKFLYTITLIALISLFCLSSYKIYDYFSKSAEDKSVVNDLANSAVKISEGNEENCPISIDFEKLWESNKDIIAWIYSENTVINYPIVKSSDNQDYLRTRLDGKYSTAGTLFFDCRNNSDLSDFNTIIYGHNMRNKTMFGTLKEYSSQEYYNNHSVLWIITPDSSFKLEPIAGYVTSNDSSVYELISDSSQFEKFLTDSVSKSTFSTKCDFSDTDRLITLSTCSDKYKNARYVLICAVSKR